ncbi:MAG: 2-C-methyl-D-erythritol 2,4-cyclodiphosphate synthase [Christensenellales bacterium]|jgi:2-C-methyl-D-erythritol 4-phosphate cytidylyltransferase/2-C-methyl-D-erythritol 2,4-cyclodiphosphate synthase
MKAWAVIVAAGKGARAGFDINKVYMPLGGTSVLSRCLSAFADSGLFEGATLVVSAEDEARLAQENIPEFVRSVVHGGKNRQESVLNGLKSAPEDIDIIAIHDAARPFVTREIIEATLASANAHGSGVISTPVTDTIKQRAHDGAIHTPERSALYAVQTPQSFRLQQIVEAHMRAAADGYLATDDAALYERYIGGVRLVTARGAEHNKKLTTRSDFMQNLPNIRVGHGYDAHRLGEDRKLILCGVEIPHERGLLGHSDADVALHALMDAMLGAAALGDIGRHFPDTGEEYRDISSLVLLRSVVEKLSAAGYVLSNADITIVAQRPKLAPYMERMRETVAGALGVPIDRVNVKATSTERMGFEGAQEGISAHAAVVIAGEGVL